MLTGKQKAKLRSIAQNLKALYQIGKDGVSENMLKDILNYLNKHEILKISVLPNCPITKVEIKDWFEANNIEVAQIIGKTIVIYKQSDNAVRPIIL